MNIAIDISPLEGKGSLYHRVRGTGFYLKNLKDSLLKYFSENNYTFFTRGSKLVSDIDIVHFPYFEPFFLTLPIFEKFPYVVTVHDLTPLVFPQNFPPGLKGKIKWKIQKRNLGKARRIITDSNSSKNDIVKLLNFPEDKVDVVYLASDEKFKKIKISQEKKAEISKKYQLPEKFILYVGDVTWNKNLPRLIKACLNANFPLVIAGKTVREDNFDKTNPWNRDLAEVQKLSYQNKNIIRTGFVENKDLITLYNIAEAFAMPSLYEGFGLPILEAMSCGCPVITSKEGSLPEVAGDAAFYVDPYSESNIEEGIVKVFSDQKLQIELSKKGLRQAQNFSWKKTAEKTMNAYQMAIL